MDMRRKEFERITPEQVGICSEDIEWLLDQLESGITEPHGLMIMRHGKKFVRKVGGIRLHPESVTASSLIPRPMRRRRLALRIPRPVKAG